MKSTTILIIEDDRTICAFITAALQSGGYKCVAANTAKDALAQRATHNPELILLDLGLPDMDGLDVLRHIRRTSSVPVIIVSARGQEQEKVTALDLGADDYMTKPFGTHELMARIRTAMRRASSPSAGPDGVFEVAQLKVDFGKRQVFLDGQAVHLTQVEYRILSLLCSYPGRVLTYDFMIRSVWGANPGGDNQILRVNMANIRRKIEKSPVEPRYILTETGVGYRMRDE